MSQPEPNSWPLRLTVEELVALDAMLPEGTLPEHLVDLPSTDEQVDAGWRSLVIRELVTFTPDGQGVVEPRLGVVFDGLRSGALRVAVDIVSFSGVTSQVWVTDGASSFAHVATDVGLHAFLVGGAEEFTASMAALGATLSPEEVETGEIAVDAESLAAAYADLLMGPAAGEASADETPGAAPMSGVRSFTSVIVQDGLDSEEPSTVGLQFVLLEEGGWHELRDGDDPDQTLLVRPVDLPAPLLRR
jgi:hypothetical protein